jgi:cytochrome o ubiquinol oxidase operon protein cyoD
MDQKLEYRNELRSYIIGLALAATLTAVAFVAVAKGMASRPALLWIVGVAALAQILAHFRFFLQVDLSRSKRDDLQLILFSMLIAFLMVGGTIWILGDLRMRMM